MRQYFSPRGLWEVQTVGSIERWQAIFLALPFLIGLIVCIPLHAYLGGLADIGAAVFTFSWANRICKNNPYGIRDYIWSYFSPKLFRAERNLSDLFEKH